MTLTLLNYKGEKKEVNIGDLEDVGAIIIRVITGDEVLDIITKDYEIEEYDPQGDRTADYPDMAYTIYNSATGINELENPKWLNRKSSYDW